jgi:hypothetical protein
MGIDGFDALAGRLELGPTHFWRAVDDLALQVGLVHHV